MLKEKRKIKIGRQGYGLSVVDGVLAQSTVLRDFPYFANLPYRLSDFDRSDTAQVRHFANQLSSDALLENASLKTYFTKAVQILDLLGISHGRLERAYINLNFHGDEQFSHDDGNLWTVLFFLNPTWNEDWRGEFVAYEDGEPAHLILPKPGRAIVFDGRIVHRGGTPSKFCTEPRLTLAMKFAKAKRNVKK
jgi:hypothetical protein